MKFLPLITTALVEIAALVWLALSWQSRLENALPPREELPNSQAASAAAIAFAKETGGMVRPVLGTGSMAPYIPSAAPGLDTRTTVVAYVVTDPRARVDSIYTGALVLYAAPWSPSALVLHQAASRDAGGWIMTGLNNRAYENWMRVTSQNFIGIAARVFTWPQ